MKIASTAALLLSLATCEAFSPTSLTKSASSFSSTFVAKKPSSPTSSYNDSVLQMALNDNQKSSLRARLSNKLKSKSKLSSSISIDMPSSSSPLTNFKLFLQNFFTNLKNMNEVSKWRIAAATFISSIFIFSNQLDVMMIQFWNFLQHSDKLLPRMFRHDHWEWGVAVWAFFFWIHGFWLADRAVSKADARGIVHPWKKYRLQDQYEAEKFRRMQTKRLEQQALKDGVDIDRNEIEKQVNAMQVPEVKQHKWNLGFWIFELPLYVLPLYIWDICIPRRAAKIAAWQAPTALGVFKDVTSALLLYDLGFFVCHFLMHKIKFLYKYVHSKHHITTEVRASDIVRLSFVEEIVDVGISILALNHLGCHPISRTLYNIIITFMLTELHCGFAFPWTPQFVVPFGLATGSKGHHYHHRYGKHYYQKFFCHVDKLFGFVQKKDDSLKGYTVSMKQ